LPHLGKAYHDALTQLPNRTLMFDRLNLAIARNARTRRLLVVCFADLDNFKPINDNFGHAAGDRVLIEVARRLRTSVRGGDTVARLGGDEFIVLLSELEDESEVLPAVERMINTLNQPLEIDGHVINVEVSMGYSIYPDDSENATGLISLADQAMYDAKYSDSGKVRRYRPRRTEAEDSDRKTMSSNKASADN